MELHGALAQSNLPYGRVISERMGFTGGARANHETKNPRSSWKTFMLVDCSGGALPVGMVILCVARNVISAQDLDRWATTPQAKFILPELLRRLVFATVRREHLQKIDFPAYIIGRSGTGGIKWACSVRCPHG